VNTYYILSGEWDYGEWSGPFHTTERGIKNRATRQRCKGARWADVYLLVPGTVGEREHLDLLDGNLKQTGEFRHVPTREE